MNQRIFVSYTHRGKGPEWKAALLRALHVFERQHLLDVWQDGKIRVSAFWDDDIKRAMADARLAVVLLTKEALEERSESDPNYILTEEFPVLRDRQQHDKLPVFPVVCEPCNWRAHDWLRATQAPNASNPLSDLQPHAQDRVFRGLATAIAEELSRSAFAELPKSNEAVPDNRIYLERFPLTHGSGLREEKLIGREQELALLDLVFAQPHTAIVSLVAWGGVGKSMLVRQWLQRLKWQGWLGARRVYAWSFFSQGTKEDRQASEDMFLAHALAWFGVQCEPTLSPWDKGRLLADAVVRERTLLVLDGIEPLQYPPSPAGGQLRAPGVQSLLKQLARRANNSEHGGLCLVTTREPLTDLAEFQRRDGSAWGTVLHVDLGNLTEEAGAAVLHHADVKRAGAAEIEPDDTELLAASREVDGHALTLNLLGRFLARAHNGDIRRRDLVKFEEADRRLQGGTTFKMLAAFEEWFARSGELYQQSLATLRLLSLFDGPAEVGCIGALRTTRSIRGVTDALFAPKGAILGWRFGEVPLNDEEWNAVVSFLIEFCLITRLRDEDNCIQSLDCHPLIREFFATRLRQEYPTGWRAAHARLCTHLEKSTTVKPHATLKELEPLYRAIRHACLAGLHNRAWQTIFLERIQQGSDLEGYYSIRKLGAQSANLAAYSCFFDRTWDVPAPILPPDVQMMILAGVGYMLHSLGRLGEAAKVTLMASNIALSQGDASNASIVTRNLVELQLALGAVSGAPLIGRQCVDLAAQGGDWIPLMIGYSAWGEALHFKGIRDQAKIAFANAEKISRENHKPGISRLYSLQGFRYCEFLLHEVERAAWQNFIALSDTRASSYDQIIDDVTDRADSSLELTARHRWLRDVALDHLTLGKAGLFGASFGTGLRSAIGPQRESIRANLWDAVDGARVAGQLHELPRALFTRGWFKVACGDVAGAQDDLDEAWDIASRGPMRLHMADIHLYRARLFFREKPYPWKSPQDDLAAAEKLINECGYHRRDEELADAKKAILREAT